MLDQIEHFKAHAVKSLKQDPRFTMRYLAWTMDNLEPPYDACITKCLLELADKVEILKAGNNLTPEIRDNLTQHFKSVNGYLKNRIRRSKV